VSDDQETKQAEQEPERRRHEGTHDAQFVPPALTLVRDDEWDATHITWEGPDGTRFRVHHDDWRYVCPKVKDVPPQPASGWIAIFEDGSQWFRTRDGLWYRCNTLENATGVGWEALWAKHGTAHHQILCPVKQGHYPFMMPLEGPEGSIVLPDLNDEGDPDLGKGFAAFINEDQKLVIRHLVSNSEITLPADHAFVIFAMFIRTFYNEKVAELAGPKAQDTGTEVLTIPED